LKDSKNYTQLDMFATEEPKEKKPVKTKTIKVVSDSIRKRYEEDERAQRVNIW